MTRKDYVAIAIIISNVYRSACPDMLKIEAVVYRLADHFADENPRGFNREQFLRNAGVK